MSLVLLQLTPVLHRLLLLFSHDELKTRLVLNILIFVSDKRMSSYTASNLMASLRQVTSLRLIVGESRLHRQHL